MILGGASILITRNAKTSDGQGGFTEVWVELESTFGSARPANGREVARGNQLGQNITHVAYLNGNSAVKHDDRITIGEVKLRVLAVRNPAFAGQHLECDCEDCPFE